MSVNGRDIKKATKEAYKRPKESNPFAGVIFEPEGQRKFPGQITKIPGNTMSTEGYGNIPLWTVPDVGYPRMVFPDTGIQYFPGATSFTEFPMMRGGGPSVEKAKAMLEDGTAWGHPLTQKQIDLFRSIVGEEEDEDTGEEYRRGGQKRKGLPRGKTSQNIQSSLNFLMTRNPILFGRYHQALYDPNAKMEQGGWLDKYQDAGQLRAATTYQGPHQNPVEYEQKVNARVKQIDDKLKTSDKAFVIYDGALYNNPYADPTRNEFLMPDKHGNYVASGITPFDVMLPVQSVAAAKGAIPLLQKVKTSDIKTLAKTYGTKVAKELKDVANAAKAVGKDAVNVVDNAIITPIQFRKEIKEIKELAKKQPEVFNNPVTQAKLKELDIDPDLLQLNPKQFESLSFNSGSGSAYFPWADHINIDMRQINKLKKEGYNLSPRAVYEHELGHKIQQKNYLSNRDVLKELLESNSPEGHIKALIGKQSKPTKLDDLLANELKLSVELGQNNPTALKSWDYYTNSPVERLAHLREMRQGMIDKGIIKDQFQPITKGHIKTYVESTPNDRIVSFMNKEDVENYSKLRDAFKLLPAAIPVGLGIGAAGNKKYGGWLDKYQEGNTVLNRLKEEQALREAAEAAYKLKGNIPGTTFVAPTMPKLTEKQVQFASLPKYQQEAIKQQNIAMSNRKPEAQLKQGKPMTKAEKDYSEKVKARIANPYSDIGIAAGNMASYLTRLKGLSPEEIARVTNNPMETIGLSSELGALALFNEMTGMAGAKALGKGIEKATPYIKHFGEDLPHYLPKVSSRGIEFPEYADYYRIQPHGFNKSKVPYNPNLTPEQNLYTGRWVETDPVGALDYVTGIQKKNPDLNPLFDVIKGRMPKSRLEQLRGTNLPEQAKLMSYGPGKYGTWESAFSEGAITDLEKSILSLYEKNPEMFKQGSLHKAYYDNVVRKIAKNPELIKESEALLPDAKISMANLFNKMKGLTSKEAEEFLRKAAQPKGGIFKDYKKYSPFEKGGTTKWLDNYE